MTYTLYQNIDRANSFLTRCYSETNPGLLSAELLSRYAFALNYLTKRLYRAAH